MAKKIGTEMERRVKRDNCQDDGPSFLVWCSKGPLWGLLAEPTYLLQSLEPQSSTPCIVDGGVLRFVEKEKGPRTGPAALWQNRSCAKVPCRPEESIL